MWVKAVPPGNGMPNTARDKEPVALVTTHQKSAWIAVLIAPEVTGNATKDASVIPAEVVEDSKAFGDVPVGAGTCDMQTMPPQDSNLNEKPKGIWGIPKRAAQNPAQLALHPQFTIPNFNG